MTNHSPEDWSNKDGWDGFFNAELSAGRRPSYPEVIVLRFLYLAKQKGGRIWFPGCGLDQYPTAYAERGCNVLATDISSVAITYQQELAAGFLKGTASDKARGTLVVREHDFTEGSPGGEFDIVINCRAFQGLSSDRMGLAAKHFHAALRPGGVCVIDTMNVQGDRRNVIEESLITNGFYIPFWKSNQWYRKQLDATGIVYEMVLGRPRIPACGQYPAERFSEFAERDQKILESLRSEYEQRYQAEAAEMESKTKTTDPSTIVAHVVYATG